MPRSPSLTSQTLIALGPECLAELLLGLAGSDPAIKRRIRLAVANATSPQDAAAQVRQRLATPPASPGDCSRSGGRRTRWHFSPEPRPTAASSMETTTPCWGPPPTS